MRCGVGGGLSRLAYVGWNATVKESDASVWLGQTKSVIQMQLNANTLNDILEPIRSRGVILRANGHSLALETGLIP